MKYLRHATRLLILCTVALLAVAVPQTRAHAQYVIDYVIRPYKSGIFDSWFFGINNHGQTTGYIITSSNQRAFEQSPLIYRAGDIKVLATGSTSSGFFGNTGFAINDPGDVVGTVERQPTFFATSGRRIPIVTPGLDFTSGLGLNDARTVLTLGFPTGSTNVSERYGLWTPKSFRPLPVLDVLYPMVLPPDPNNFLSGPQSFTFDQGITNLNKANQFAAGVHQFFFDPKDPNDPNDDVFSDQFLYAYVFNGQDGYSFLQPATSGDEITPIRIDKKGRVFGWSGDHLALWRKDGSLKLVYPDPGTSLQKFGFFGFPAAQRNNRGQVVAMTSTLGVVRYNPKSGAWTNITSSIRELGTGLFFSIQGFNDRGQFVGLAMPPLHPTGVFGFVVSPVREMDEDEGDDNDDEGDNNDHHD